ATPLTGGPAAYPAAFALASHENEGARPHMPAAGPLLNQEAVRLVLIVLERELELFQRTVDRADRFHSMTPEVVGRLLQMQFGTFQGADRRVDLRVRLRVRHRSRGGGGGGGGGGPRRARWGRGDEGGRQSEHGDERSGAEAHGSSSRGESRLRGHPLDPRCPDAVTPRRRPA